MKTQPEQVDQLFVLVHGVGDPQPGDSLGNFARSVALEAEPLKERSEVLWLSEKADDSAHVQTFPVHVRQLHVNNRSIQLAEVFWGDLSRVLQGVLGIIAGVFQILFGLRYVAYVAADQPGIYAAWLKKLGLVSSRILHGPVAAVTVFLAVLAAAVSLTQVLWTNSYQAAAWTRCIIAACTLGGIAISLAGSRLTRNRVVERFWFWLNVTSMFLLGLMLVRQFVLAAAEADLGVAMEARPGLVMYCRVLVVLLALLWFCEILVLIGMAFCWVAGSLRASVNRRALDLAFLLPALAIGTWGLAIPMLWLFARATAKKFLHLDDFAAIFEEAVPLLGVQFAMCVVVTVTGSCAAIKYLLWRSRRTVDHFLAGDRAPRLIVNGGLQKAMVGCTLVGASLVVLLGTTEAIGWSYHDFWFGQLVAECNKYAMTVLVPLAVLAAFAFPRLQPVFDIALDVVNHFYFRATNMQDALDDDDEFDINETTFESGNLFFSRRQAIQARMQRILIHYRDTLPNHADSRPELVIVAHSQGTQIAIEVLNDPELDWLTNRFRSVKLITMGSPFTNLYQHYFGHIYPSLNSPYWASLRQRLDRWDNIFRIDDPVGTEIDFSPLATTEASSTTDASSTSGNGLETTGSLETNNHPVGCRGHVNYWTDREVLDVIREVVFSSEPTQSQGNATPAALVRRAA